MKKIICVLLVLLFAGASYASNWGNVHSKYKDDPEITVYLKEVTSDVDDPSVNVDVFKEEFNKVLPARVNMPFAPVYNTKDADVIVTAEIKEYVFTEKAFPTVFGGTWGVVADTATPKSLAKLVVDYKVINAKNDNLLLEYKYFATEEKRPREDMKGAQAFIHAANKNINRFIYRAFHYQRRKGGFQIQ